MASLVRSSSFPFSSPHCSPPPLPRRRDAFLDSARLFPRANFHKPMTAPGCVFSSRSTSTRVRSVRCSTESSKGVGGEEKTPSLAAAVKENPEVRSGTWNWRGYRIRYQSAGESGPSLVLVHGFGANSDHWRKNIPVLSKSNKVYAIDLIGYGYSDKPNPRDAGVGSFYTFDTWADQLNEFCTDVVRDDAFFICNSIGGWTQFHK